MGRPGLTVLVFEGRTFGVASSAHCGVGTDIQAAVNRHRPQLAASNDLTATVADFAAAVRKEPSAGSGCSGSVRANTAARTGAKTGHPGLIIVLVIVALLIAVVWYVVHARRRRAQRVLSDARAQVMPYYDLLAAEVNR